MECIRYKLVCLSFTLMSVLIMTNIVSAQKYLIGANVGFVVSEESGVYLDDPLNIWIDRDNSFIFGIQFYKVLTESFMVGGYAEHEALNNPIENGSRHGFGVQYLGRYPEDFSSGIRLELGGMFGLASASLGELDSQFGVDYGVFFGPVIQINQNLEIAAHLNPFYGWYGGGDIPEGVQNTQPRLKVQIYWVRD